MISRKTILYAVNIIIDKLKRNLCYMKSNLIIQKNILQKYNLTHVGI